MLINQLNLKNLLQEVYGINVVDISDAPRGFVAETFVVVDDHQTKFFIKVINAKTRFRKDVIESLPVLEEMKHRGINSINYPIHTLAHNLYFENENILLVVFNFIEGKWSLTYDKVKFLQALKLVHNLNTDTFVSKPRVEDFSINFERLWLETFEKLKSDPSLKVALGIDDRFLEQTEKDYHLFLQTIKECQSSKFQYVITHSDAPGNVIENVDGDIFIIDWDNILLAPIERDLWFHTSDLELAVVYPDWQMSKLAYRYYVLRRYFDDFAGFLEEIYKPNASAKHKEQNIQDIKADIFEWLLPLVVKIRI